MAPMTRTCSPGGVPGEDVAAYYRRRAEGGTGLIITEGAWIPHSSASNDENAPRFYGSDALAGWRRVVEEVHAAGGKIAPQLWHVGLTPRPVSENIYDAIKEDFSARLSPSGYIGSGKKIVEGMTEAQGEELINAYAEAAETAQSLGFDAVEFHGAHGYLIDQFLWSETNHRTDRWGGKTLRERTAFAVDVIRACRQRVGPDFPLILRISQWKLQDYGGRLAETPQELESLLGPLADAGVDIFHGSQRRFWEPEFEDSPLNLAGWAKKLTGKPAIAVGSVGLDLDLLETNLHPGTKAQVRSLDQLLEMMERGDFDLIAVGRGLIADADWSTKVRTGQYDDLHPYEVSLLAELK